MIELWNAWRAGQQLANSANWKIGAILSNAVGAVLLVLIQAIKLKYPDFVLPPEVLDYITQAICYGLAAANIYVHKASSAKV